MGLGDIFKINEFKAEIARLSSENQKLHELLTPEMQEALSVQSLIQSLQAERESINENLREINNIISQKQAEINSLDCSIQSKKSEILELDDKILLQEFGMYTPIYSLMTSNEYKEKIETIRSHQKHMIKTDIACSFPVTFTLDGSLSKGRKLVKDNIKQILRSFNNECDVIIDKVKFNNFDVFKRKIEKSYADLNKMNEAMQIKINQSYLKSKIKELHLCYEYAVKKQEEKEEQKRIREQLREEAKLQKEIEEARKTIEKEKAHYTKALKALESQLSFASESEKAELLSKQEDILLHLGEIEKSIEDIDYREANKRAGYVYIISNIGSFGEDVYKIGMTRRLDPTERIDELGDASVPFNFDIHAMIFSDDAPSLENALHKAFENKKLNMINYRREFFHVTLDEIEEVVKKNFDKTVEFTKTAIAEQYRESLAIKNAAKEA